MKTFLKQVLAILVALTIFFIGSCAYIGHRLRYAADQVRKESEAKRIAEEEAEKQRIIQFNKDFLEMHNEMRNHPISPRPQN